MDTQVIKTGHTYSLKKGKLKRWLYNNHHSQPYLARKLHITTEELKRKLLNREPFSREQICTLIYLMGAGTAFNVIYFPTIEEKQRVYAEVFGKKK